MDALVSALNPVEATQKWLDELGQAMQSQDAEAVMDLFQADCFWRDVCAFTWNIETFGGRGAIEAMLDETLPEMRPRNFHLPEGRTPPRTVSRGRRLHRGDHRVRNRCRPV